MSLCALSGPVCLGTHARELDDEIPDNLDASELWGALRPHFADALRLRSYAPLRDLPSGPWGVFVAITCLSVTAGPPPLQRELCAFTGYSERAVRRFLGELETAEVVRRSPARGGVARFILGTALQRLMLAITRPPLQATCVEGGTR